MFRMNQAKVKKGINSFVGTRSIVNGNIQCPGCLVINGKVNGDIKADGDIYISRTAVTNGNISADRITVSGIVEGNITSKGILRILSTGKISGDINVGSCIAEKGGIFVGSCSMKPSPLKLLESMYVEKRDKGIFLENMAVNE